MIYLLLPAYALTLTSCMCSKTDSKRVAMEENKTKFAKNMCMDTKFAVNAAEGGMMEVKLAELAQANASSASVKQFAKTMLEDHTKSNAELKSLAAEKKISLPGKLSDKSQKAYDWIAKKQGADFDKAYMKCMVRDHKMDVCEFEKEAKKAKDADLQKWASGKVPVLKAHLEAAKLTCKELK
ncbi:MAG: outer membrane protein-like protein [Bacteroidetes bacterium]|nr:outer membrane protein-like protein [Bacteroidota bacterium]